MTGGSRELPDRPALSYEVGIDNRGLKPVKIDSVYIDYGDKDDADKRMKYVVAGEFYLKPGSHETISQEITWQNVEEMKKRFNIYECHFFFRIKYRTADGRYEETSRSLLGFGSDSVILYAQRGDSVT